MTDGARRATDRKATAGRGAIAIITIMRTILLQKKLVIVNCRDDIPFFDM